jgi:hypothetical protein
VVSLSEADARPTPILVDELDTGGFQSASIGQIVRPGHRSLLVRQNSWQVPSGKLAENGFNFAHGPEGGTD